MPPKLSLPGQRAAGATSNPASQAAKARRSARPQSYADYLRLFGAQQPQQPHQDPLASSPVDAQSPSDAQATPAADASSSSSPPGTGTATASTAVSPLARTFPSLRAVRLSLPRRFEGRGASALLKKHLPPLKYHNPHLQVEVERWQVDPAAAATAAPPSPSSAARSSSADKGGSSRMEASSAQTGEAEQRKKRLVLEFANTVPREIVLAETKAESQLAREILDLCLFSDRAAAQQRPTTRPTSQTPPQ